MRGLLRSTPVSCSGLCSSGWSSAGLSNFGANGGLTLGNGQGAEGWLVDPGHLNRLAELLDALPGMAIDVARAKAV